MLGVIQWFFLLQRLMFSVLDCSYAIVRREPVHLIQEGPPSVLSEMAAALTLLPLLLASLDREDCNELMAKDASPEFGFGVSWAPCTSECARKVGSLACPGPDDTPEPSTHGNICEGTHSTIKNKVDLQLLQPQHLVHASHGTGIVQKHQPVSKFTQLYPICCKPSQSRTSFPSVFTVVPKLVCREERKTFSRSILRRTKFNPSDKL